ncbi:MAG TPA: NUDIX domain-containing protein, partial [Rhodanobacteraceae bacterium]|nr:NUDIX domain-containing protein [Rhodanobacteraceae bacterium]
EDRAAADRIAASLAGLDPTQAEALPPLLHVFTHYRLRIHPLLWREVPAHGAVADSPDQRWCTREDLAALGIPAPVRRLLAALS